MNAMFRLIAASGALSLAGACTSGSEPLSAGLNPSVYSVHQPVVQRTDYVFDVAAAGGLAPAETQRLHAWFQTLGVGYGDRVAIDQSSGYVDAGAREQIASVAGYYGLLLDEGGPTTAGQIAPGAVRVVLSRTTASVPGCPDWSHADRLDAPIATDSNFGCATNSNLAAMIADPNDLVRGRIGGTVDDADEVARSVKSYRNRGQTGGGGSTVKSEGVGK